MAKRVNMSRVELFRGNPTLLPDEHDISLPRFAMTLFAVFASFVLVGLSKLLLEDSSSQSSI